jgi:hypothetical protein
MGVPCFITPFTSDLDDVLALQCKFQFFWRIVRHDLALLYYSDSIAELVGLVDIVGREEYRHAPFVQFPDERADQPGALDIQAARRLIEE